MHCTQTTDPIDLIFDTDLRLDIIYFVLKFGHDSPMDKGAVPPQNPHFSVLSYKSVHSNETAYSIDFGFGPELSLDQLYCVLKFGRDTPMGT